MPAGSMKIITSSQYSNISASTSAIKSGVGQLSGIFVASASATPTIKVYDSLTGANAILVNTFTPTGATWYPMPFQFRTGLSIVISGTVDCTVAFS